MATGGAGSRNAGCTLVGVGGRLCFDSNDDGWCQVSLQVAGESTPLGAERWDAIAARLHDFLADDQRELRWVLSLAERHTAVYGEGRAEALRLRFQDERGQFFAELELGAAERDAWLAALSGHAI